jgi:hypothetical protein
VKQAGTPPFGTTLGNMSTTNRDRAALLAVVLAAAAVYVSTLAPGLIAITDTPKFQFIGRILGTAHPPGYPLYVLVSHLFGWLPIGSLAYRINLMSAAFGAAACGLAFVAARLLGVRRSIALAAALALAFGSTFWYVSTIAEVYTLNVFLFAGSLVAILAWQETHRAAWFFAAVALVGIAMGNHTTIVFMVPALACCAVVEAPRFALHPRTIVAAAAIVALALTQYSFIIIRTHQGAWGEAPASNLRELARVVAGAEYFGDVMPGGIRQLARERAPIVWNAFVRELSPAALILAAAGAAALWRRSKAILSLFLVAGSAYVTFGAAYMPHQFEVFLVPAFVLGWLLAAAGAEWFAGALERYRRPLMVAAPTLALMALAAWQITRNYDTRDLSHQRADMRFFDALFDRLPQKAVLLDEDFLIDRMVHYKTLGEAAAAGREILANVAPQPGRLDELSKNRYSIFAFPQTSKRLRLLDGFEFSYSPMELQGGTFGRFVEDLPAGSLIAMAAPARQLALVPQEEHFLTRVAPGLSVPPGSSVALVAQTRSSVVRAASDPRQARVHFEAPFDRHPPVEADADGDDAVIKLGGREILRTRAGIAVAAWTASGPATFVLRPSSLVPPTAPTPYQVYALRSVRSRLPVGPSWIDLTAAMASGNFIYSIPAGRSRLVLFAARQRPLAPALLETSARDWPRLEVRTFEGPHAADGPLAQALRDDQLPAGQRLMAGRFVYRVAIDTGWPGVAGLHVGLGGVPDAAYGRFAADAPASLYGLDLQTHLARVDDQASLLHMARNHHEHLVGAGWSPVQADGVGPYRETIAPEAELTVPLSERTALRVGVQLIRLPGAGGDAEVGLSLNQQAFAPLAAGPNWRRLWWNIPGGAVKAGVNSLVLSVSPGGQRIAVSDVLFETTVEPR